MIFLAIDYRYNQKTFKFIKRVESDINKSRKVQVLVHLFINTFFAVLFYIIITNNLGIPTRGDYAHIYMENWVTNENKSFNNIYLNAGYNIEDNPHPGLNYFIYILSLIGIPINTSISIIILFGVWSTFYFPYTFARIAGLQEFRAVFTGIWGMVGNFIYIISFASGNLSFYFGTNLIILGLLFTNRIFQDIIDKRIISPKYIALASLFYGLAIMTHLLVILIVVFVFPIILYKPFFKRNKEIKLLIIKSLVFITICSFLVSSVFVFRFLKNHFFDVAVNQYEIDLPSTYLTNTMLFNLNFGSLLYNLTYFQIIYLTILFLGLIFQFKRRINNDSIEANLLKSYISYGIFYLLLVIISYTLTEQVLFILPFRFNIFVELTSGIVISQYLIRNHKIKFFKEKRFVFALILTMIIVPIYYNIDRYSDMNLAIESDRMDTLISEINTLNVSKKSRILVENSDFETDAFWGGQSLLSTLPIYTDEFFISEIGTYYFMNRESSFYDGNVFGMPIQSIEPDKFIEQLELHNIRYIIAFYNISKTYLNNFDNRIKLVKDVMNFTIYEYVDAKDTYITSDNIGITSNLQKFETNEILFSLNGCKSGDSIQFSLRNSNNWKLYLNNSLSSKDSENMFINFTIPANGDYNVKIVWETTIFDRFNYSLSIISILGFIFVVIFHNKENKKEILQDGN